MYDVHACILCIGICVYTSIDYMNVLHVLVYYSDVIHL